MMNLLTSLFGGGNSSWSAAEAKARMEEETPLLILDVREKDEYQGGHIPGAKHIPLGELSQHLAKLPQEGEILCVCQSGARSGAAASQLKRAGLRAINLRGGMMAWRGAGYAVKKGK
jgi:rhodanese-related sulfurtransferase